MERPTGVRFLPPCLKFLSMVSIVCGMDPVLREILHEAMDAVKRQGTDISRKSESLRQLGRTGMAAMAGLLAGAGLLAQASVPFPPASLVLVAAGALLLVLAVAWAVVGAAVADGLDVPIGPDPSVLAQLEHGDLDMRSLMSSRLELAVRMHAYNESSQERASRRVRIVLLLLIPGAFLVLAGFAFVLGGAIVWM